MSDTRGVRKENPKNRKKCWYSKGANPNPSYNGGWNRCADKWERHYRQKIKRQYLAFYTNNLICNHNFSNRRYTKYDRPIEI